MTQLQQLTVTMAASLWNIMKTMPQVQVQPDGQKERINLTMSEWDTQVQQPSFGNPNEQAMKGSTHVKVLFTRKQAQHD